MSGQELLDNLSGRFGKVRGRIVADQPLAPYTWFRVGGPADIWFQPADFEDLQTFLRALPDAVPVTVVGVGSNLLVRDGGIEGVVIRLSAKGFGSVEHLGGNRLRAGAAVPDRKLAAAALDAGIGGFAFYHGIPGSIGGALKMNAGANGTETTERLVKVIAVNRSGEKVELAHQAMGYSYRKSNAPDGLIFAGAEFQGVPATKQEIHTAMDAVQLHRETVQPVREKTGGSTFKNPPRESAWKLVERAGMRGFRVGDAQMSTMHCNFMINTGAASAHDLETLGEKVRHKVLEKTGIQLDWEIKRIGRFAGHAAD